MKTKPFNLEEALANPDRVVCRDGVKPTQWCYFKDAKTDFPIKFTRNGSIEGCKSNGSYDGIGDCSLDLVLTAKTKLIPFTMETFMPHRNDWFLRLDKLRQFRINSFSKSGLTTSIDVEYTWSEFLDYCLREDGSPCGVEVEE